MNLTCTETCYKFKVNNELISYDSHAEFNADYQEVITFQIKPEEKLNLFGHMHGIGLYYYYWSIMLTSMDMYIF